MKTLIPIAAVLLAVGMGAGFVAWFSHANSEETIIKNACRAHLQKTLNDPASLQEVRWMPVREVSGRKFVALELRAKNGFGAMVLSTLAFELSLDNKVAAALSPEQLDARLKELAGLSNKP